MQEIIESWANSWWRERQQELSRLLARHGLEINDLQQKVDALEDRLQMLENSGEG